ncbi:MAG: reverse gyrase [Candidatus Jordarchaeales archaeon]
MSDAVFAGLCPSCGGDLTLAEVESSTCKSTGRRLCSFSIDDDFNRFLEFFERAVGASPRALQRLWARRVLRGESFAAVAPTGTGKTAFGAVMALFLAERGLKSYIIVPTTLLVRQVTESINLFMERTGVRASVKWYHSGVREDEKESFFKSLSEGDFQILVTTSQFLSSHFGKLRGKVFSFLFIDDVDSVLKASRNVERLLMLLGFEVVNNNWEGKPAGVLMVSTATAKPGGKAALFKKLLNFEVGSSNFEVRNIEDIYFGKKTLENLFNAVKLMGGGGIVYCSSSEEAMQVLEFLNSNGVRAGFVGARSKKDFDAFCRGELDVLVGAAYYYGVLVRGLNLPERVRYTVFYGAPFFRVKLADLDSASTKLLRVLAGIFREDERLKQYVSNVEKYADEIRAILKENFSTMRVSADDVVVKQNEVFLPDLRTYIQGSGRASRLHAGGITKGASMLLEDEEFASAFIKRASYYDLEFKGRGEVDFEKIREEIDRSRRGAEAEGGEPVKPALFIVESPTKARQIARFFGQPSVRVFRGNDGDVALVAYDVATGNYVMTVAASLGHVVDLVRDRGFFGVLVEENQKYVPVYGAIRRCRRCGYQFVGDGACPKCREEGGGALVDSKYRIEVLRRLAKDAELVIVGTDPDAEGEKIAWDLKVLLRPCAKDVKRAEFHEVTKRAVVQALRQLRDVDERLVEAQIVRRVEDRWNGFSLSRKLWDHFKDYSLSAGRVQSPVLGWIIRRAEEGKERKIVAVIDELSLTIEGLTSREPTLEISLLERRSEKQTPPPPYTTNALLRDANSILKLSVDKTMQLAQDLFENGLITYHRTDSTRVSERGLAVAKEYLKEDFTPRTWEVEGAHEAIRPTRPLDRANLVRLIEEGVIALSAEVTPSHLSLYDLVFRRFMASQCPPVNVVREVYRVRADGVEAVEVRVVKVEGRAHQLYKYMLPPVKPPLPQGTRRVKARILRLPKEPPYTQSDVVELMKERGIGRPSTYATIIQKLFLRGYVEESRGRLKPTEKGIRVYSYLNQHYGRFISEERTRQLEEKMDMIEKGLLSYQEALNEIYHEVRSRILPLEEHVPAEATPEW